MKIVLCGGPTGPSLNIATKLMALPRCDELAIFTHEAGEWEKGKPNLSYLAEKCDLYHSCENINDAQLPWRPDIIVSVYYRHIIKPHIIQAAKGKIFNAHASLLPRNRGRSPIPWAIVNGDRTTGITYHYINSGIDTGRIILQAAIEIAEKETQESLFKKVDQAVIDYFPAALGLVMIGFPGVEQSGNGSYHKAGPPYGGEIDPNWTWGKIMRFIRAMAYPPRPYAHLDGAEIKDENDYKRALLERSRRNRQPIQK